MGTTTSSLPKSAAANTHLHDINKVFEEVKDTLTIKDVELMPVFLSDVTREQDATEQAKRVVANVIESKCNWPNDGSIRFVCISDTHSLHSYLPHMPPGDVLIHAGDFSNVGSKADIEQLVAFLEPLPYKHKIIIAGNHDLTFEKDLYESQHFNRFHVGKLPKQNCDEIRGLLINNPNITYLEDEEYEVEGYKIYGSPWQPEFCQWAFNLYRGSDAIISRWKAIPTSTDILITHGPPLGYGDLCNHGGRAGCADLLREIATRIRPSHHIFGHIHEGYGVTTDGVTTYINASSCNYRYDKHNLQPPVVFDLPKKV